MVYAEVYGVGVGVRVMRLGLGLGLVVGGETCRVGINGRSANGTPSRA